jgi:predicted NAD/FAD-dependent oxidoreductase
MFVLFASPPVRTRRKQLFLIVALRWCMSATKGLASGGKPQRVAIIGGGIAGLSCAQELATNPNFDVTVYDTGRLRPGGRCSHRQPGDPIKEDDDSKAFPLLSRYRYDHAAQLIAVSPKKYPKFSEQLKSWKEEGIVQEFPLDSVFQISKEAKVEPITGQSFYHGTNGMGNLPMAMVKKSASFHLDQDTWVSPSSGVRYQKNDGTWKLQAKGKTLGYYDKLVIAHNGKCADRIMSRTPAKDVHALLRVNFAPTVPADGGKKMTLNSLYSLTVVLPASSAWSKALPNDFVCGFVDHPKLRMITYQTRKYPNENDDKEHEVWNILSSAQFAKQYKAPQEFLPDDVIDQVTELLVHAVDETLNLSSDSQMDVLENRVQLWGAAVPLNVWKNDLGFLYDATNNVGVVGDWLIEPSIAGAWTSGYSLASHLNKQSKIAASDAMTVGLEGSFERSESVKSIGIASIPQ